LGELQPNNFLLGPAIIARIRSLAMLLMAQRPPIDEMIGQRAAIFFSKLGKRDGVLTFGNGIYLVVKDGTRYTTSTRPSWARDEDILEEKEPVAGTPRRDKLIRAFHKLKEIAPESLIDESEFNIPQTIQRIQAHYDSPAAEWELEFAELLNVIGRFGSKELFASGNNEAIKETVYQMMDAILQHAHRLYVCGDIVVPIIALLEFFHSYSQTSDLINIGILAQYTPPGPQVNFPQSNASIDMYLTHPGVNASEAIKAIHIAAVLLRKSAWRQRREAMQESGMVSFHTKLYRSYLLSQASRHLYEQLLIWNTTHQELFTQSGLDAGDLHLQWVEVEEARVAIVSSISFVAMPSNLGPDSTDPETFLLTLQDWLKEEGPAKLERIIHDMALRLLCPELIRDLALGWLDVHTGQFDDSRTQRLQRVVDRLEKDLARNTLAGNLDYLSRAYRLLAMLHRMRGEDAMAEEYNLRGEAGNFHKHVQAVLDEEVSQRTMLNTT
jgi:hypothetical protein